MNLNMKGLSKKKKSKRFVLASGNFTAAVKTGSVSTVISMEIYTDLNQTAVEEKPTRFEQSKYWSVDDVIICIQFE